jgi:hypothetical protein
MVEKELQHLTIAAYLLGYSFCWKKKNQQRGDVCIFVRKDHCFSKIDISQQGRGHDLDICAIQLDTETANLLILSLYKAPSGDIILRRI